MESETQAPEPNEATNLRNRLVAAIVKHQGDELALARLESASAVFGVASTGAPVALVTYSGEASEAFSNRMVAVAEAQPGTLYVVVVGGTEVALADALASVATRAPDLRSLGLYHLTAEQKLVHVGGRRLGALESAAKKLGDTPAISLDELRVLAQEAQRTHADAVKFSQQTRRRFPVVSLILGAVCVLVFFRGGAPGSGATASAIFEAGVNYGPAVRAGEIWRLLSSAFLHGGQSHLLANMLSLYFLGTFLEQLVGRSRYLVIYGLSALGGSLASALLASHPSVGASGAIWGLMTAGFGLSLRPGGLLPLVVATRIKRALTTPLLINIGISFLPNIDLRAHFGGGAVGLLLALSGWLGNKAAVDPGAAAAVSDGKPVPTPRWVHGVAAIVALAMAAALAVALLNARGMLSQTPPLGTAGVL